MTRRMWGAAPPVVGFRSLVCLFLMLAGLMSASVPQAASAAGPTFADVPATSPFYAYVEEMYARGITNGCGVNASGQLIFCPLN